MTEWTRVCGSVKPSLIDTTSSSTTVYERRNIRKVETPSEEEGVGPDVSWEYEERSYTIDEYAQLSSPTTKMLMQQMSEIELNIAMLEP